MTITIDKYFWQLIWKLWQTVLTDEVRELFHLKLTLAVATSEWIPAFTSHHTKSSEKDSVLCRNLKSLKSKLSHQDPRLRVTGYHGLVITRLQPSDGGDYSCQVSENLNPAEIVPIVSPCFVQALPGLLNSISLNLSRLTTWVLYRRSPTDYRFKNKDEKSLKVRFAGLEQFFWKTSDCMNLELRFQVLEPPKLQKRPSGDDPIQVRVHVVWCRLFCLFFVEDLLVWSSLGLSRWLRENQWLFDVVPVEFQTHWSGFTFILFQKFELIQKKNQMDCRLPLDRGLSLSFSYICQSVFELIKKKSDGVDQAGCRLVVVFLYLFHPLGVLGERTLALQGECFERSEQIL